MAFDNFNWKHNNRGSSDPALHEPEGTGDAPQPTNTNAENERIRLENERRRKEATAFSGPSTKDGATAPQKKKRNTRDVS